MAGNGSIGGGAFGLSIHQVGSATLTVSLVDELAIPQALAQSSLNFSPLITVEEIPPYNMGLAIVPTLTFGEFTMSTMMTLVVESVTHDDWSMILPQVSLPGLAAPSQPMDVEFRSSEFVPLQRSTTVSGTQPSISVGGSAVLGDRHELVDVGLCYLFRGKWLSQRGS